MDRMTKVCKRRDDEPAKWLMSVADKRRPKRELVPIRPFSPTVNGIHSIYGTRRIAPS